MLPAGIKKLYDINPKSWEHPADKAAMAALRGVKGLDEIAKFVFGKTSDEAVRLLHLASSVRVTPRQFPTVYDKVKQVCEVFDWKEIPDVFVSQSPFFNAGTYGIDKPFIVLNSSVVNTLSDTELSTVIAHEMGHVMSGHAVYKTLLSLLVNISSQLVTADFALVPVIAALREWDRKSELSADRAGLLGTQREDDNYTVLMKMAGGTDTSQFNLNDFFDQAEEYEEKKSATDGIFKLLNTVWETHPFPVVRLRELKLWAMSGQYEAILNGTYIKREFHKGNAQEEIQDGFKFYKNEFDSNIGDTKRETEAAFAKGVQDLGKNIRSISENLEDAFKKIFDNKQ